MSWSPQFLGHVRRNRLARGWDSASSAGTGRSRRGSDEDVPLPAHIKVITRTGPPARSFNNDRSTALTTETRTQARAFKEAAREHRTARPSSKGGVGSSGPQAARSRDWPARPLDSDLPRSPRGRTRVATFRTARKLPAPSPPMAPAPVPSAAPRARASPLQGRPASTACPSLRGPQGARIAFAP